MSRHTITGNVSEKDMVMEMMMELVLRIFLLVLVMDVLVKDVYLGEAPGSGSPMPGLGPTPGGKVGPAAGPVWVGAVWALGGKQEKVNKRGI